MHYGNELFWKGVKRKYPGYFSNPSEVIEFGSLDINGSIRDYFTCLEYVGVDWRDGQGVDLACLAHEVPFMPDSFDAVVSASMLEHDPYWEKSLSKMVDILRPTGLFVISWGGAYNPSHHEQASPDGKFHSLKAGLVIRYLEKLGMYIHEFMYERRLLEKDSDPETVARLIRNKQAGIGEVALTAFKDKRYSTGEQFIDSLLEADRA